MEKKENRCPLCKEEIERGAIRCKHCKSSIDQANPGHDGTCPLCKEAIHPEAIKCKHCLSMLVTQANTIRPHAPFSAPHPAPPSFPRPKLVKRGVEVKILTNSLAATDNLEAFSGYKRDRRKLLETGVKIFEFRPDAAVRLEKMNKALNTRLHRAPVFGLHAKSMVVDGVIAVIGTFNLDPRSANLNTECITVIHSDTIASRLQKVMDEEFKPGNAWAVTLESHPDAKAGFIKRFRVWIRGIIPKKIL